MTAQLIDGKAIAQKVRDEVAAKVAKRTAAGKPQPTLATVLVGDRPDSAAYVSSKGKACLELGMGSISEHLPVDATQEQVESLVKKLNADKKVNAILVQLPMPPQIDEERVLSLISIEKDVDGFSPLNIGRLAQKGRKPLFVPCTPYGCIYLLEQVGVKIEGQMRSYWAARTSLACRLHCCSSAGTPPLRSATRGRVTWLPSSGRRIS